METITFYSYKGGVGRTLALVNIANRISEFGKKVCIIDFDLEAPGLNHKYKHNIKKEIKQGLVDYIYEFAINNILPDSIKDYTVNIKLNEKQNDIIFIPAGNSEQGEYWKKLSRISWWNLFYKDDSEGIPFFLDLKEKIKAEFNPDYLLIDTRTGITEISAITMSVLSDQIALFAINNDENICGTQHIIQAINKKENNLLNVKKDIHFVLTRLPLPESPEERSRELEIKKLVEQKIEKAFEGSDQEAKSFNIIHSNKETEIFGRVKMGYDFEKKEEMTTSISYEYMMLFNSLIGNNFTSEEKERLNNRKQAEQLLKRAYDSLEKGTPELLKQLEEIEKLASNLSEIDVMRGHYYNNREEYTKAIESFSKGIEKGDDSGDCLYYRYWSYLELKEYKNALADMTKYIDEGYRDYRMETIYNRVFVKECLNVDKEVLIAETTQLIGKYPYYAPLYNMRSDLYRQQKNYSLALGDIYKAIDLEPTPVFYTTLAEIKFSQGEKLEFYRNLDEALKKGFDIENILSEEGDIKDIYRQVSTEDEFARLLEKHDKSYFLNLIANSVS